jgi:DNA (cytosine-5)-methyltransferase 1
MQVISLFSGIGGFELAAEWVGWKNIVSCEIDPFGRKVLKHYWPESYHHKDIHTLTYAKIKKNTNWNPNEPTIIVGGFPCQPFSIAGQRKGTEDNRNLWPEMFRIIKEIKPDWVVGENVHGIVNWSDGMVFDQVQSDLENIGYEVQAYVLPSCAVNAPHRRDRVWIVAHTGIPGLERGEKKGNIKRKWDFTSQFI